MDATDRIQRIIAPTVEDMGYDIVRVQISGMQRPTLQIMAERRDDGAMTVEDCAEISRAVSAVLDVEDPIASAYTLEISSPGIDRPLTRLKDYERFAEFEARVETRFPIDGRKRFRGLLRGVADEAVQIETDTGMVAIPFADIQRGKLVLTDALIAASLGKSGPGLS
jgi:ribosome maturation factor RimP